MKKTKSINDDIEQSISAFFACLFKVVHSNLTLNGAETTTASKTTSLRRWWERKLNIDDGICWLSIFCSFRISFLFSSRRLLRQIFQTILISDTGKRAGNHCDAFQLDYDYDSMNLMLKIDSIVSTCFAPSTYFFSFFFCLCQMEIPSFAVIKVENVLLCGDAECHRSQSSTFVFVCRRKLWKQNGRQPQKKLDEENSSFENRNEHLSAFAIKLNVHFDVVFPSIQFQFLFLSKLFCFVSPLPVRRCRHHCVWVPITIIHWQTNAPSKRVIDDCTISSWNWSIFEGSK